MENKSPSQAQLKLLNEVSTAKILLREEEVLENCPNWTDLEKQKIIPKQASSCLTSLHKLSVYECITILSQGPEYMEYLIELLKNCKTEAPVQYYLTLFHECIRTDTSIIDTALTSHETLSTFTVFINFLEQKDKSSSFTSDKASFILTSLIARSNQRLETDKTILGFIDSLVTGKYQLSFEGRLDSLKNLLKLNEYREILWKNSEAKNLIYSALDSATASSKYLGVFCCWLLTLDKNTIESFVESGGLEKICVILRTSKTEKVVRICINALLNCLLSEVAVEEMIRQNTVHTLTLLEYEKWRDQELYTEIHNGLTALQYKINLFTNFDRYVRELSSGKLNWSFLHSDKFWHENVRHFEENEFSAVKKLVGLLTSDDSTTLAVACFDLGEFARLYPTGKKVIQKLKAKELVMILMSHKNREVSREALLCVQKMMLDNWKIADTVVVH